MNLPAYFRSLAAKFFHRFQIDREMAEELFSHIQHRADDLERSGMSRANAERQARIEFGARERYREECNEAMGGNFVEGMLQDTKFVLRTLRKSPGFAVIAVLTLALAIGANAVVFSLMNGLILRPLNVPQSQNLYTIEQGADRSLFQSYPDYLDLRDRNRSFEGVAAYGIDKAGLDTGGKASAVWLYEASGNYFDLLGIQPYLGRFFHASDEHGPNSAPYIVLSYAYWHSHFQGDPSAVGRTVLLNKYPYTIAGVARPDFRGSELFFVPDFWVPFVDEEQVEGTSDLNQRGTRGTWLVGRLKAGVTPAQATADLNSIAAYLAKTYPKEDDKISFCLVRPGLLGDMLGRPVRAFLAGLMLLAGLILLAACANLGSLFTARAADHAREIALRLALGSSRRRVLRQMLTEAVLISLMGGTVGMAGSIALLRWLSRWQPMSNIPIANLPVNPDFRVYAVALLLALASGLLFGLIPIRQVLRANPWQIVKAGTAGSGGRRRFTVRDALLVVQVAICAVLVTSSLVAVRGLLHSLRGSLGFVPQNALLVETDLGMAGYRGGTAAPMQRRIRDALMAIPGVSEVGYSDRLPLALDWYEDQVFKDTTVDRKISNSVAEAVTYDISPSYFSAAGTTLIAGRTFTWHDDKTTPRVTVVNREFARKVFGSEDAAIGGYFRRINGDRIQVVGVVEDGKHKTLAEDPEPAMFFPIQQAPSSETWLVIRSSRDPRELTAAVESTLLNLDAALPFRMRTWEKELDSALFASRMATVSLGILGALGAMLAVTGIFGMAAYSVSRRLRELGIRIALGAQRKEVLRAALGRAFRLLAFGSLAGMVLGLAATRVLSYIVYEATPRDPLVLAGVVVTMLLLGLGAAWIPASRALGADPLLLLREE
jgi:predicted permease